MSQHEERGLVMTVFITHVNIILTAGLFTSLLLNYIGLFRSWEFGRCVINDNDRVHYSREHYHRSWSLHELIAKLYKSVKELGV